MRERGYVDTVERGTEKRERDENRMGDLERENEEQIEKSGEWRWLNWNLCLCL